jgi:hypothetical protein
MVTGLITTVGTTVSLTKALSSADAALFTLVADDLPPPEDDPAARVSRQEERARVPDALVAALMASAALRHAGGHADAEMLQADVRRSGDAWVGDTLTASAAVLASDPGARTVQVQARCVNEAGQQLAEGQFTLRARA